MIDGFHHQLQIEEDILLSVRHSLDDADVVPLEEIPVQLQPVVFLLV